MALVWLESFDHADDSSYGQKYDSSMWGTINPNGRTGKCWSSDGGGVAGQFAKTLAPYHHWLAGFAFRRDGTGAARVICFSDEGTADVWMSLESDFRLHVYRAKYMGSEEIGASTTVLVQNVWYYVELSVVIDPSAGAFELRVNGITEASGSGYNTAYGGNATADKVDWGDWNYVSLDDLYLCNDLGAHNNDFLGDIAVHCLMPNGAGNYSEWAPQPGANWENVSEIPPDDDTSYNETASAGNRDSYQFADLAAGGAVLGIQLNERIRKEGAGSSHVIAPFARVAGADYDQAQESVPDNYIYVPRVLETDPSTGLAWSRAALNAAEFGIKLVS